MFTKNMNAIRIVEQYGVTSTDKNAYVYGEFDSTVAVQAFSSSDIPAPAKLTPKELAKIKAEAKIEAKAKLEAEAQAKLDADSKV